MKCIKTRNLVYILVLVSGVFCAALITPILYKKGPSDFKRTSILLNFMYDKEQSFDGVVLGNSIFMSGINSQLISDNTGLNVVNFSTTGQGFMESVLYYPEIRRKQPKVVFQGVSINEIIENKKLDKKTINNFKLSGYRIDADLSGLLPANELTIFNESRIKTSWQTRSVVINQINTFLRSLLRKDIQGKLAEKDLYYPNAYTERIPKKKYDQLIQKHNPPRPFSEYKLDKSFEGRIVYAKNFFKEEGVEYVLIIAPVNPDLMNYTAVFFEEFQAEIERLRAMNISVLDMSNVLSSEDFVDHFHPSINGALRLSNLLSNKIKKDIN